MFAVDTNVVVRFVTRDDPVQARKARRFIEANEIFVPLTVLLETEWVLRRLYGFGQETVLAALRSFAGLPQVTVEAPSRVALAMQWAGQGMDFADGLHLASAEGCEAFVSFDRRFARSAREIDSATVRQP